MLIGLSESAEAYERRGYTPDRMLASQRMFAERFGMPFGFERKPRMAGTARACRAIVAARELDPALGEAAFRALQLLQFTTPRLLDDDADLRAVLSEVPGLDAEAIVARIDDPEIVAAYEAGRAHARSAQGSPTHAQGRFSTSDGPVRYTAPSVIFEHESGRGLEVGGFQPFEAYDTVIANLDPGLDRRGAPASATEALAAFPEGLTTAELASVMRPSRPRGRRPRRDGRSRWRSWRRPARCCATRAGTTRSGGCRRKRSIVACSFLRQWATALARSAARPG